MNASACGDRENRLLDVQWMTRVAANDDVADILVVGKRVVLVDVSRYQTVYLRVLGACAKQRQLVLSIDQINWDKFVERLLQVMSGDV